MIKNEPLPPPAGRPYKYKFDQLKTVGDYIPFRLKDRNKVAAAACTYAKKHPPMKVAVRKQGKIIKLFRTA